MQQPSVEVTPYVDPESGEIIEGGPVVPAHTRPIISPAEAKAGHDQYLAVCEALLTDDDYNIIQGRPRKSKSAWRKLANAFGISDDITDHRIERDPRGRPVYAWFIVRAMTRNGRQAVGYHEVHLSEKCCPTIDGEMCPRARYDEHSCCTPTCAGFIHWSGAGNIPATAHTRAKNRAISDLIGAGEVSAEELDAVGMEPSSGRPGGRSSPQRRTRTPAKKAEPKTDEESAQGALFAAAQKAWPDTDPHNQVCNVLNLPAVGKGALTQHWLNNGGTYRSAIPFCTEVRSLEKKGTKLEDAIKQVDAYGALMRAKPPHRGFKDGGVQERPAHEEPERVAESPIDPDPEPSFE